MEEKEPIKEEQVDKNKKPVFLEEVEAKTDEKLDRFGLNEEQQKSAARFQKVAAFLGGIKILCAIAGAIILFILNYRMGETIASCCVEALLGFGLGYLAGMVVAFVLQVIIGICLMNTADFYVIPYHIEDEHDKKCKTEKGFYARNTICRCPMCGHKIVKTSQIINGKVEDNNSYNPEDLDSTKISISVASGYNAEFDFECSTCGFKYKLINTIKVVEKDIKDYEGDKKGYYRIITHNVEYKTDMETDEIAKAIFKDHTAKKVVKGDRHTYY